MDPSADDLHLHLPLRLIKSEIIPAAPNPVESSIDWLPDLCGYSWLAYGASSLLVISHFPSPLSQTPSSSPIFRQVFHISSPSSADVSAVSWSPAIPSSGDLAAATDNRILIFQIDSALGPFCWSQTALLLQSAKVESIAWTDSGDGIVSAGLDLVLWKRHTKFWEIAWKFRMRVPQSLLSTTWSLHGPSASALHPTKCHPSLGLSSSMTHHDSSYCVNVFLSDAKSGYVTTELCHPQPVLSMQWRPTVSIGTQFNSMCTRSHVLLTTCLDGTLRLWTEIDDASKIKRTTRNSSCDSSPSFCVVAVIEINHSLHGTLGTDIFVYWGLEVDGLVACMAAGEGNGHLSLKNPQNAEIGRCEWLIGLGPGKQITFWAVHCLDDMATMRSPRITLWKKLEIQGRAFSDFSTNVHTKCIEEFHFSKVAIWRNQSFGPPKLCSLIKLHPCSSLSLSVLYSQSLFNDEGDKSSHNKCETDSNMYCQSEGILDTLGHTGKLLEVAVHPSKCDVELAVSLDSNGLLIFWSIWTSRNGISSLPALHPSWEIIGKFTLQTAISKGIRLHWTLSSLDENRFLLVGHSQGIDCLIIKTSDANKEKVLCHKLCTVPFVGHDHLSVPDEIISVPLHSSCKSTNRIDHFLLLAIWMKKFKVNSWKVSLHSHELSGNCSKCDISTSNGEHDSLIYQDDFAGKTYCVIVDPVSSHSPVYDQITSAAIVCSNILTPSMLHKLDKVNDSSPSNLPFHMATGHSDGITRLWKICLFESSVPHTSFELVGTFSFRQRPVSSIAVADCGQKIATICPTSHTENANILCIWEPLSLAGVGTFVLEDKICLNGNICALRWFFMGNIMFLGVCFQDELRIYSQRVCSDQTALNMRTFSEVSNWVCIAVVRTSPIICNFFLGPRAMIIIMHEKFFSLFSQCSFLMHSKHSTDNHLNLDTDVSSSNEMDEDLSAVFSGKIQIFEESLFEESSEGSSSIPPLTKTHNDKHCSLFANGTLPSGSSQIKNCLLKMTKVAEKFRGPLPLYHPTTLLMNILSGNWKRAYVAVSHLVECLALQTQQGFSPAKSSHAVGQVKLSRYFEGRLSNDEVSQGFQWSENPNTMNWSPYLENGLMQFGDHSSGCAVNNMFSASATSSESCDISEMLNKWHALDFFTESQKMELFAIIDLLREINDPRIPSAYESLDEPGRRFWCAIRLQQLDFHRRYKKMPLVEELVVDSMLIGWAFHSECQASLFGAVLPTEPTWEEMRKMGVGFWFTNLTDLRNKMEKLARCRYLKSKDPRACALLYIALNRLQVLTGHFKISKDEKDKQLVTFLSRNFQEEKHKAAALKNAYVLMGKHQFELAVAFFLLGGDITSAINLCAKTLGDGQLALVICRLVEGQGGPSERQLISRILLPSAIEKTDYWLASVLEWILGNYLQSSLVFLDLHEDSHYSKSENPFPPGIFSDPSIGLYCRMLVAKTKLRNAIGEQNSAILCWWATVMSASALAKCGLPLEALEWLSLSDSVLGAAGIFSGSSEILPGILRSFQDGSPVRLSHELACHIEYQVKLDLAVQYLMTIMREHPYWHDTTSTLNDTIACSQEYEMSQHAALVEQFEQKFNSALAYLEQKFSLIGDQLLNKIFFDVDDDRLFLIGYHLLHVFPLQVVCPLIRSNISSFHLLQQLVNDTKYMSSSVARFVTVSSISSLQSLMSSEHNVSDIKPNSCFQYLELYLQGITFSFCCLRAALMVTYRGSTKEVIAQSIVVLDLYRYCIYFASAMLQRNTKALVVLLQPVLTSCDDGSYTEVDKVSFRAMLTHAVEVLFLESSRRNTCGGSVATEALHHADGPDITSMIPEDEKWLILATCLWQCHSNFVKYQLSHLSDKLNQNSVVLCSGVAPMLDGNGMVDHISQVISILVEAISRTVTHVSSHSATQLSVFFEQKVKDRTISTEIWLKKFSHSNSNGLNELLHIMFCSPELSNQETLFSELLAKIFGATATVSEVLTRFSINLPQLIQWNPVRGWHQLRKGVIGDHEKLESYKQDGIFNSSPRANGVGSPSAGSEQGQGHLDSGKKGAADMKNVISFYKATEIYRKNGELLEALCINSIEQHQAAVASNKKGISFFNWAEGLPTRDISDYIWSKAEWPQNGWVGANSTPVPTCFFSSGGLRSDIGLHAGLVDAAVGVGFHSTVGRDLSSSEAFEIPGYAGIDATSMGSGIQEDSDYSIDPPPTLDYVNARTLATHPSRPFFLVGSNDSHIYLWEFGEEKAAATYGTLPAANVPLPYALASITAMEFDSCGHRFASSASDGIVCTWQLEFGGRSNVRPTESSLCFSGYASDICYVATSGSIIAAAGYNSNGVNVVIWDTLAPSMSSRASVMCHEGGACSIAVFDNDMGTSSVSPLIVTGGKGGDIGLHDFRYIATGKTKRTRHVNIVESITDVATLGVQSELSSSVGDQNRNGMIWYIPKAHSGSVTKITTIPNTSLFLTGSKDGDVKLWDAKKARLVCHWPKLHERHTFLHRGSQGFGGMTRVGVTDIGVISDGFVTCGGDGLVKLVLLNNSPPWDY